jgi:hypothetical protein
MTIYLHPEVASGLGEDTFWTWARREFPGATFDRPRPFSPNQDCYLQYSTLGQPDIEQTTPPRIDFPGHRGTIALCWELYPEMRLQLGSDQWDHIIARTEECARHCRHRVVATRFAVEHYSQFGTVDVLPIGVDTDLFKPRDQAEARDTLGLQSGPKIGLWCGTSHPMKGFDYLEHYAKRHPEISWILAWKSPRERVKGHRVPVVLETTGVQQTELACMMNAASFYLVCGRLRPYFLVEWEAMATDLPIIDISGLEKDFEPGGHPREDIFRLGWDRPTAKKKWLEYLGQ